MKAIERAAIARVLIDLIKADKVIDSREMELYRSLKSQFSITRETEIEAYGLTLSRAVGILKEMDASTLSDLLHVFEDMTASDGFCAREEALLMLMLHFCLDEKDLECDVISNVIEEPWFDERQVLYVESRHSKEINFGISSNPRAIERELRLCGFSFVYIPQVVHHYISTSRELLNEVVAMLSPSLSENAIAGLLTKIKLFKTDTFCVDQLSQKLGFTELIDTFPALMFRISQSRVGDRVFTNFLRIELTADVVGVVEKIVDIFLTYYGSDRVIVANKKDEKGSFLYNGFYRQFFELLLLQKSVRSNLLVDLIHGTLSFPDVDLTLPGIYRKEKAFYVLFIYESYRGALRGEDNIVSHNGGINFTPPVSSRQLSKFKKRMATLQRRYARIYAEFGGDLESVPDISNEKIRLPMISAIRKSILKMQQKVFEAESFLICRDKNGFYGIQASPDKFICQDVHTGKETVPIVESKLFLELDKMDL